MRKRAPVQALAVYTEDERFKRKVWVLKHIHSPYVPGFQDAGE